MTKSEVKRSVSRLPTHPGVILRDDVLPALKLNLKAAAAHTDVSREALQAVLSGRAGISPEFAARIGKLCGNGPDVWLRLQMAHDLWLVEHRTTE